MMTIGFFSTIALALILLGKVEALRDVRINIPAAVIRGDDAILDCCYDLEGDILYTVKWYRGSKEFYRFTLKEKPPIKQFGTEIGITVREADSNATRVVLERVPMNISGHYSCEVSADAPSFFTKIQSAFLQVVELPSSDPLITGVKTRYHHDEILLANCSSMGSSPAANLTWYINSEPAKIGHYKNHKEPTFDGKFNSHSHLRLKITKHLFNKRLKIRCVASMYNVYYRSNEKSVEPERKRHSQHRHHVASSTAEPMLQWELVQEVPRHESTLVFQGSGGKLAAGCVTWLAILIALR